MANPYSTYLAYSDNNSFTSERGASKFLSELIETTQGTAGDNGCVINGFYVSAATGMKVNIQRQNPGASNLDGHCIIKYNDYAYFGWLEADYQLTLDSSSSSGSRYSYIVAYVDRSVSFIEEDHIIESPSILKFVEVKGTTSNNPTRPTSTQIQETIGEDNPYIILAEILIGVGVSSITNSNITDLRNVAKFSKDILINPESDVYIKGFVDSVSGKSVRFAILNPGDTYPTAEANEQIICIVLKNQSV